MLSPLFNSNYSPNGYKVPMEFHVYFFSSHRDFFKMDKNAFKRNASNED